MIFIIYTAEIPCLMCVSGYKLGAHVRNTTVRNILQKYALEERIEDDENKQENHFLRMDSSKTDPES
jgi:hypothetical protein